MDFYLLYLKIAVYLISMIQYFLMITIVYLYLQDSRNQTMNILYYLIHLAIRYQFGF